MNDWDNQMNFSACWKLQFVYQITHFSSNRKWFFSQWEQFWWVRNLIFLFIRFRLHNIDENMILELRKDMILIKCYDHSNLNQIYNIQYCLTELNVILKKIFIVTWLSSKLKNQSWFDIIQKLKWEYIQDWWISCIYVVFHFWKHTKSCSLIFVNQETV